jgi:CheY-like chemotaxis protein
MGESIDIDEPILSDNAERVLMAPEDRAAIRILVVDDEPSILESCETVLSGEGYVCQVERRGEEALRRLKGETFEIVLIDQNMPQVHGLDILAELRKRNPDCLAIVMTGHATTEDGVKAIQAGAWDYLPKPFTATQLLVLIGRAAFTLMRTQKMTQPSHRRLHLHHGRERNRQRAVRPVHSPGEPPFAQTVRCGELRRSSRRAPRIRDVRPPTRSLHRGHPGQGRVAGSS